MDGSIQDLGIDEAGYAPRLGPLVVTAVSFMRPEGADLYEVLDEAVRRSGRSRKARGGRRRLHVGDSKKVYSPSRGLAELERSVLAFTTCALGSDPPDDIWLARELTGHMMDIDGLPWYAGPPGALPAATERDEVGAAAEHLARILSDAHVTPPSIRSRLITARDLNGSVNDERNKADFLCALVAGLLAEMSSPVGTTIATIDRLGGRKDYRPVLQLAWPGIDVEDVEVASACSSYRALGSGVQRDVAFACKAEDASLPVGLASMISKYLRELFMRRLNRWFAERVPGIAPTAGYPVDAARFLKECEAFREDESITDDTLIRSR
jgi:hypothetical protein